MRINPTGYHETGGRKLIPPPPLNGVDSSRSTFFFFFGFADPEPPHPANRNTLTTAVSRTFIILTLLIRK